MSRFQGELTVVALLEKCKRARKKRIEMNEERLNFVYTSLDYFIIPAEKEKREKYDEEMVNHNKNHRTATLRKF